MHPRRWPLAHDRFLDLGGRGLVMGVLNVTPDSFSDGGRFEALDAAVAQAEAMAADGAAIVDIGGESTRPGATPVTALDEQRRVLPVIEALAGRPVLLSVDTAHADTARAAVRAGAHIVNDVWGLQRDPGLARLAADTGAGVVAMHTGRERRRDPDPIADQFLFLRRSIAVAREAGVADERLVLDPGFGFAKETVAENLALVARFGELHALGFPLLVGVSRKRFLGAITDRAPPERDTATAALNALLRLKGAALFRVHDVRATRDALLVADAVLAQAQSPTEP